MRKIVASIIAGGLLVGAAFAAAAVSGGPASAQEDDTVEPTGRSWRPGHILEEVLADLVEDGTLSQDQADAVTEGLQAKVEELREDHPGLGRHPLRRAFRLGALLDEGVITADELAELPDGHPLEDPDGPAAEYLEDGEITADEFRSLLQELHAARHNN